MHQTSQQPAPGTVRDRFGALVWIIGSVQFFLCHLIVQSAWPTPYSWSLNNISDLGNVNCQPWGDNARYVCSPLHTVMNTSIIVGGLLIIVGIFAIESLWRRSFISWAARVLLIIVGLAWLLVGLTPADVEENLHVLGALFIMIPGNLGLMLMVLSARYGYMKTIRILATLMGIIGLVATGLFFSGHYLTLGMGGMERVAVFPLQIWNFIAGCTLLIAVVRERRRAALEALIEDYHEREY
ncbi:hypothetical protein EPA93_05560 [Ktedonosporobacter rubrisoli]|uniref:DUF998 domain-containing protein n=1 Tax=Ktedonosporobacter rubrisoli TaxID=2509675 RepID=A0A4P6JK29_KTERU|nr:DUF998 domain-containing protein [Ktedonosporobacter rubrisoli]QBD75498.1 hypothetical protein EPA93_05560 [Ktedonosporobacter rubrisoli]